MPTVLKFSVHRPAGDRVHHITPADIRIVLDRLPPEVLIRLRAVHLNDRSRGARTLGYVNMGHREIALCALPPRISLARFLRNKVSPNAFGARRGSQWSSVAIRRFLLYDVLLHELGHLQVVHDDATNVRRRFAGETKAQGFADCWRKKLWAESFDHADPAHSAPSDQELHELTGLRARDDRHSVGDQLWAG